MMFDDYGLFTAIQGVLLTSLCWKIGVSRGERPMSAKFRHLGYGLLDGGPRLSGLRLGRALLSLATLAMPALVQAAQALQPDPSATAATVPEAKPSQAPKPDLQKADAPKSADQPAPSFRARVRVMIEQEVRKTGLPADIADAVVRVESNYDPMVIGGVGEIGLMQIRPIHVNLKFAT